MGVGQRRGVQARGDETREVGHVDPELGADLVGDGAEGGEVELARVRRPAGDDHGRLDLERLRAHSIHVDEHRLGVDAVGRGVVDLAGEVEFHAVREVAAVGELEAEDRVAGRREGVQHGSTGRGARVGLHVGELSAEERLGPLDGEVLGDVDELAAAVVALAGVPLGVLVRQHGALGFEDGARHEVLARDHLERVALAAQLLVEHGGDLGVHRLEGLVEGRRQGIRHGRLLVRGLGARCPGGWCAEGPGERPLAVSVAS